MPSSVIANRLLALLPEKERASVLYCCDEVALVRGETFAEPGEIYRHVYFPLCGFTSLISIVNGKSALETGLVGPEGMLGATVALGVGSAPTRALVQGPGTALRMEADVFSELLVSHPGLYRVTMHYLYVMIEQLAQTSVCNRYHVLESRLARWLMMTRDRAEGDTFDITQQFLARMLGVRREGVTGAAYGMQQRGLIHYRRGHLQIIDPHGLEQAACCYGANKEIYERILAQPAEATPSRADNQSR